MHRRMREYLYEDIYERVIELYEKEENIRNFEPIIEDDREYDLKTDNSTMHFGK